MIDLRYPINKFKTVKLVPVDLSTIEGIKTIRSMYQRIKTNIHPMHQSLYLIEFRMMNAIAITALNQYSVKKGMTKEERTAFANTQLFKSVVKEQMTKLGIKNRPHLISIVQMLMNEDYGLQVSMPIQESKQKQSENSRKKEREAIKPTKGLKLLINEARVLLENEGLDHYDIYAIAREVEKIAYNRYSGDNYANQLKRMGIASTLDLIVRIRYEL